MGNGQVIYHATLINAGPYAGTRWKVSIEKRKVGKPTRWWTDNIIETAGINWATTAKNREEWRRMEEAFTQTHIKALDN